MTWREAVASLHLETELQLGVAARARARVASEITAAQYGAADATLRSLVEE